MRFRVKPFSKNLVAENRSYCVITRKIRILNTLGPSTMDPAIIKQLDRLGVDIFRINLSHTQEEDIEKNIRHIMSASSKPLCLDLEGAQIRSGFVKDHEVFFETGATVKIHNEKIIGDSKNLSLNPCEAIKELCIGDYLSIDFDNLVLRVFDKEDSFLLTEVISSGVVGSNKAASVSRLIDLPTFSPKDLQAIQIGLALKVPYVALSFASQKSDVERLRGMVKGRMQIISKIESKKGLRHFDEIAQTSDALLLDRGDISREIPIEMIPFLQKRIIRRANEKSIPIYVATNLLESMVNRKVPTRAEVNDIMTTLMDGADGLVLAAETAIGRYPIQCVEMVKKLISVYELSFDQFTLNWFSECPDSHFAAAVDGSNKTAGPSPSKSLDA